ncbi:MAG: UPF0175 family protein [Chloroflexi bacterium]|nr:UPF0175 family protein [Chloroflexota bacterium]
MAGSTPSVHLPEELAERLRKGALKGASLDDQVKRALAIHLFLTHQVTLGSAAELADTSYRDFWDLLVELGLPVLEYGAEQREEDAAGLREYNRRKSAS